MSTISEVYLANEKLAKESRKAHIDLAQNGGARCWLKGVNPGDEVAVLTIYGGLTSAERKALIAFAMQLDERRPSPAPREGGV